MPYGALSQGFVAKPATVIKQEMDAAFKASILGASAGTEPDGSIPAKSVAGQLIAFMVDGFAGLWDLAQAVYNAATPGGAVGVPLDAVCEITGTQRLPALRSTVTLTCTGTPLTFLLAGRVATVTGTGVRFRSTLDGTLIAATAWAALTPYVVGDRRTNAARVYLCITAGNSAAAGGPTTTAADIVDGTVHWRYLGEGTGEVQIAFEAEDVGAFAALSGTLVTIATPVAGWASVINVLDAAVGSALEVDSALRLRREEELTADGNSAADAIRAKVLKVGDGTANAVTSCRVFFNDTLVVNADGVPAKSVEVLALGGLDAEIAAAVFASVSAGIYTHGNQGPFTVNDSAGNPQLVRFSRPTAKPIWIILDVTYDPKKFPIDLLAGKALLRDAVVLYGSSYPIGYSVRADELDRNGVGGPTTAGGVKCPGVLKSAELIGLVNPPIGAADIPIGVRDLATFDTSRITVNLVAGTP